MLRTYRERAVGALLDEYERAIIDLQQVITDVSDEELTTVIDKTTTDPNCKSIQTILSHVVRSGYACAIDIKNSEGNTAIHPDKLLRFTVIEYQNDLNNVFVFAANTFQTIPDNKLEQFDNTKKIKTPWGQVYDIEQMIEHEIVHVLRHRRQIERFKITLKRKGKSKKK